MIGGGRGRGLLIGVCASAAAHLVVVVLITLLPWGPAAMGVSSSNASSSSAGSPGGGFPGDLAGSVGGDGGSGPGVTAATAARSLLSSEGDAVAGSAVTERPRSRQGDSAIAHAVTRIVRDVTPIPEFVAHLWESTLFALAIGLLTLLVRRHTAAVRYRLWVVASLKFLVPFSLLATMGGYMAWMLPAQPLAATADVASTTWFASTTGWRSVTRVTASPSTIGEALVAAVAVAWLLGVVCVAVMRFRIWRRIRAAVRVSLPLAPPHLDVPRDVEVRLAPGLLEPGVVGWRHPILLLPADLGTHLTSSELDAVIAHEMCHVRRWDNHTAMLHMVTEALFWFHPLVWWIGARLVSERERACDEAVLRQGTQPRSTPRQLSKRARGMSPRRWRASPASPGPTCRSESR